jgi:hypothetical protein
MKKVDDGSGVDGLRKRPRALDDPVAATMGFNGNDGARRRLRGDLRRAMQIAQRLENLALRRLQVKATGQGL